ncbi:MAG: acyltransferase domain-containing protein, partial [Thermodesulfobacteriota bacterium]
VNAFGFGDINAHVILEETQGVDALTARSYHRPWGSEVVILQGDSRAELIAHAQQLSRYLADSPVAELKDLAYTVNTRLRDGTLRLALVASSTHELAQKLTHALQRLADPARRRIKDISGIYFFEEPLARAGKLAFLFPGEGPQYVNMLADLCLHLPEVRAHFDQADRVFLDNGRPSVPSHVVFPPPLQPPQDEAALWRIDVAVASVFAANCALATVLTRLGVSPDVIAGHSSGEYAALLTAGAVEVDGEEELLRHGLELNQLYTSFAERIPAAVLVAVGAMRPGAVQAVLDTCPGPLYVTMDNCPHQVVLCGTRESVEPAVAVLRSRGAICTTLPFQRGYHTPLFAPVAAELQRFFRAIRFVPPKTTVYSCATAQPFPADPEEMRQLAVSQWSRPVRFRETVEAMYAAGVRLFVEVGPGGNLSGFVDDTLRGKSFLAVPLNLAHRSGLEQLNHAVGLLAAHGVSLRLDYLYSRRQPRTLDLDRPIMAAAAQRPLMRIALELPLACLPQGSPLQRASEAASVPSEAPAPTTPRPVEHPNGPSTSVLCDTTPAATELGHIVEGGHGLEGGSTATAENGPAPPDPVFPQPVLDYLRTMERFLDVQQEVMRAFLTGPRPLLPAAPPQPAAQEPPGGPLEGNAQTTPGAAPVASGDTGPVVQEVEQGTVLVSPAREPQALAARFLALVSEKTGYPAEMLDLSLNMEADLGIDSIKRVEILGAFQQETGLVRPEDMEQAANLKTLREVIDYFSRQFAPSAAVAAESSGQTVPESLSAVSPVPPQTAAPAHHRPFVREVLSLTAGEEAVVACTLDLHRDRFLRDHVAIGRRVSAVDDSVTGMPVVPLTVSLEIMAEVATLVLPGKVLIGARAVRAAQWFALDEGRKTVVCRAKRGKAGPEETVEVQIVEPNGQPDGPTGAGGVIVQGQLVFGDAYPVPAPCDGFAVRDERPYRYASDRYYEEVMFHGPLFQGVVSIDRCGADGVQGTIRPGAATGFFASLPQSACLLDPVLLDAAGQLVGFWVADRLERGFVFPAGCAALHLYGPLPGVCHPVVALARIRPGDDGRIRADIDCVDSAGQVLARLIGWEEIWFDFPPEFTRFNLSSRDTILSETWPEAVAQLSSGVAVQCCRIRRENLPAALFDEANPLWQTIWARLILGRHEYERWRECKGPEKRRTEWLLGRLVAKDAVRRFLLARANLRLCPADIEIDTDEYGAPLVRGLWAAAAGCVPCLTLAHADGMAVAIAAECQPDEGVGVDIERVRDLPGEVEEAAFAPAERELLARRDRDAARGWLLRFWCAKEALGKALGRGVIGGPRSLLVRQFDAQTGRVSLTLAGRLARELAVPRGSAFLVHTYCDGDYVVASTRVRKPGQRTPLQVGERPVEDGSGVKA